MFVRGLLEYKLGGFKMKSLRRNLVLFFVMFLLFTGGKSVLGEGIYGDGSYKNPINLVNGSSVQKYLSSGGYHYYRLYVPEYGKVELHSNSGIDLYGYLMDYNHNVIAQDDDSGSGRNFKITRYLHRGTYYLKVKGYSSSVNGKYSVFMNFSQNFIITANPPSGTYEGAINVELLTSTTGTSINYITEVNGEENTNWKKYLEPIQVTTNTSIKVVAYDESGKASTNRFNYIIQPKMEKLELEKKVNIKKGYNKRLDKHVYHLVKVKN